MADIITMTNQPSQQAMTKDGYVENVSAPVKGVAVTQDGAGVTNVTVTY
jgi:hypothetical protein